MSDSTPHPEPITLDLTALLRLGPRSKVDLGDGHVYEVRLPYEHSRSTQLMLDKLHSRRNELMKKLQSGSGQFGNISEDEIEELDRLTDEALCVLLVSGMDDFVRNLSPAQRGDLLEVVGMINMNVMADQKKAVESTSSTLLSSVPAPSIPRSTSGSAKRPRRSSGGRSKS